ncbi:hypothetical protein GDO78_021577 [Eleutherodactylus coqui]|uniref:Sulfotransferase n=1 Tax=Eleutherodactylus coqui TaxID=57060 RepID=A0A8J6BIT1_ELECQ|nr:hypothetical protein GDO78_021577 [Eleutherodactylus coqui]
MVGDMPLIEYFADNWENVKNFQAEEGDLLIDTYPKSGTTWISEIVDLVVHDGETKTSQRGTIFERVPFLEFAVPGMPTVSYGPWGAHNKDFWKIRHQRDILYLFYEDMLEDPKREIRKVMKYVGKDLPDDVVEKIHQRTTFKAMKDNPMANYSNIPSSVMDQTISPFMRKGTCGDWKTHFTVAQNELFDEYYKKEISDTDLTFRF